MTKSATITLPDHQLAFLESQVAEGRYGSLSEAVETALRLLEEQEAKLSHLRDALVEGEESGPAAPFDPEAFLARLHADHVVKP